MNLKKKIKGFFTLTRKANSGFTLVELIVVIAILAILGGVAVPAYSGYVTKANKSADEQLISDIEQAIELAFYNQDFSEGSSGIIILSPNEGESLIDGNEDAIAVTELALDKVFGADCIDTMQLKYDNWGVSWTTMSYEDASNVINSNFVQKYSPSELMEQVQIMTNAANGLALNVGDDTVKLYDTFSYISEGNTQNAIIDVMKKYNIGEDEEDWNNLTDEQKSNVLVLATADSVSSGTNADAVGYLKEYSIYTAYAAEGDTSFNAAYENFQTSLAAAKNETDADRQYEAIRNAYQTLKSAANSNQNFRTWIGDFDDPNSNASKSMAAFSAVMDGVGGAMNQNGDAILAQLGDSNMFTTGIGNELYNNYLDAAYATSGAAIYDPSDGSYFGVSDYLEFIEGSVAVWYAVNNEVLYIQNSLPSNG